MASTLQTQRNPFGHSNKVITRNQSIIAKRLSTRQIILQCRPQTRPVFVYIYVAIVSHAWECNYWLRLNHVRWYILVPVCFWNLTHLLSVCDMQCEHLLVQCNGAVPARSVRGVNSIVIMKQELCQCNSTTLSPTCNFSFDLRNHAY